VDLAIIVVPRDKVNRVIDQCGKKGVRGVVVITAGFKETGPDGTRFEDELERRIQRHGMRMIGPNCMGVLNTHPDVRMNATFASAKPPRGNVGMLSQSGALGEAILADAASAGLGVAMFASIGNKTDVSGNDLIEAWEYDDDVQVIMMYLESFGNPRRFTQLARKVTRRKPILTVKSGRTAAGAKAASSHTGSIVGLDIATDSLFAQCGVLRVSTLEEMFVQGAALANQPLPKGDRIAIVTNAGGPAILCTDAIIGRGLELAPLTAATRRALKKVLPPEATVSNPVDMIASANADSYRKVLELVRKDATVDGIVAIFVSPIMIDAYEVARAIAGAADGRKPVLSVFMGKQRSVEGIEVLRENGVPDYRFPDQAATAMAAMCRYRAMRDQPIGKEKTFEVDRAAAKRVISVARKAGRDDLLPSEVERLLAAYGFPMAPSRTAAGPAEAIAAAQEIGYPVVLKIASAKISHKSDVGGVKVDLRNADEVGAAYREMTGRLKRKDPDLKVVVQNFVSGGREVILGMTRDPQFGPLLMFGLGGVFVEVMRDVAVGVHPLTDVDARSMIERIRGYPLLAGTRGELPVAIPMLEESLLRLSQLVGDFEQDLAEMDLNPFIVKPRGERSFVVDARISLRSTS
jgi:acetyltransferase